MSSSSPRPAPALSLSGSPLLPENPNRLLQQRRLLANDLTTTGMNTARNVMHDPAVAAEQFRKRQEELPGKVRQISDAYRDSLDEALPRLRQGLRDIDADTQAEAGTHETPLVRIEAIVDALKNVPADTTEPDSHRYLKGNTLDFLKMEQDQRVLRTLASTREDLRPDLQLLDRALEELQRNDPRYDIRQFELRQAESPGDKVAGNVNRTTVLLVSGIMFAITSAQAIRNFFKDGSISITPFFYGTIALLAYPGMIDKLFGPKDKLMAKELSGTLNHPAFKTIARNYSVHGRGWSEYARGVLEDPTDTKALVSALKANSLRSKGPPELEDQIREYVGSMPGSADDKKNLQKMIDDGQFVDFAQVLMTLHNDDAKAIAFDYIKTDAGGAGI